MVTRRDVCYHSRRGLRGTQAHSMLHAAALPMKPCPPARLDSIDRQDRTRLITRFLCKKQWVVAQNGSRNHAGSGTLVPATPADTCVGPHELLN